MDDGQPNEESRSKWLISLSEEDSFRLTVEDWYDRIRYLRELLGEEHVRNEAVKPFADRKRFWHEKS